MNYTKLSLSIFALFIVAIIMSFIPDNFHDFFGDWKCVGKVMTNETSHGYIVYEGCNYGSLNSHEPTYHWGWRHWLWAAMGITLFTIQCVNIFDKSKEKLQTTKKKNYRQQRNKHPVRRLGSRV